MRFYLSSAILHILIFSAIAFSSRTTFKPIPKTEVYKVSIAPMPQPKVYGIPNGVPGGSLTGGPGGLNAEAGSGTTGGAKKIQEKTAPPEGGAGKGLTSKEGLPGTKTGTAPGGSAKGGGRLGLPDGVPDMSPQIYTGSGRGFTYSYYLNILLNKIGKNWGNPYKNKDVVLKSIIYFEVDKEGKVSNVRLEESSGNDVYDETAMRAVATMPQLPPLPQELSSINDFLKIHLEFLTAP